MHMELKQASVQSQPYAERYLECGADSFRVWLCGFYSQIRMRGDIQVLVYRNCYNYLIITLCVLM